MDKWISAASRCGLCGDVDGRDRRRCARSGGRRAVVGRCCRDSAGAGSQNGKPEGRFGVQQGVFQRPPAPVAGPCRAAVSACSAPAGQDAGLRCALALQLPGTWGRADPGVRVCAGAPAVRRLELTHPGDAGTTGAGP